MIYITTVVAMYHLVHVTFIAVYMCYSVKAAKKDIDDEIQAPKARIIYLHLGEFTILRLWWRAINVFLKDLIF